MQFEKLVTEKILSSLNANNEHNDTFWKEYQKKKQIKNQMIEKILSNQKSKDEPTGIRVKMNNNIIGEPATEDKYILLHTVRIKQGNKPPINVLIDGGSTHTIINSRVEKQLEARILSKTKIVIETQNGEKVLTSHKVNINLSGIPLIAYSIKDDLASLDPYIKSIEHWPDLDDTMRNEVLQNVAPIL